MKIFEGRFLFPSVPGVCLQKIIVSFILLCYLVDMSTSPVFLRSQDNCGELKDKWPVYLIAPSTSLKDRCHDCQLHDEHRVTCAQKISLWAAAGLFAVNCWGLIWMLSQKHTIQFFCLRLGWTEVQSDEQQWLLIDLTVLAWIKCYICASWHTGSLTNTVFKTVFFFSLDYCWSFHYPEINGTENETINLWSVR